MATLVVQRSDQLWIKNGAGAEGTASWVANISGLPTGAVIKSAVLSFSYGKSYAATARAAVYFGSYSGYALWSTGSFSGGSSTSIDVTSKITAGTNPTFVFYAKASTAGASNTYFVGITLTIEYANPKSTFKLSSAEVEAGQNITVTISPSESASQHLVSFVLGSRSHSEITVSDSVSYTIPVDWVDQMPSSLSAVGSVTVETLSGETSLGSDTQPMTVTVPETIVPSAGVLNIEILNPMDDLCVQGYGQCRAELSEHAAGQGALLSGVTIQGGGYSSASTVLTTGVLRTAGQLTFAAVVTDSRGRTATTTASITVVSYSPIAITDVVGQRCLADGTLATVSGTSALLGCAYQMTSIGQNAATVRVMWRAAGSSWTELADWPDTSGATQVALVDQLDVSSRYEIRYIVADALSTDEQIISIASGKVFMRWDKTNHAIGFGCYPQKAKQFAIAEDWEMLLGNQTISQVVNQAVSAAVGNITEHMLDVFFPVGSIHPFANDVNPADIWGGSWELLAEGITLIQAGSAYPLGSTGGEASHTLTVDEMPAHAHKPTTDTVDGDAYHYQIVRDPSSESTGRVMVAKGSDYRVFGADPKATDFVSIDDIRDTQETAIAGAGQPHSNMQPYLAVNWWVRVEDGASSSKLGTGELGSMILGA